MGLRRLARVTVVLLAALSLAAVSCGGVQEESASDQKGSDSQGTALSEAEDVILRAVRTMFTWSPARDASPLAGYDRAMPLLGGELREFRFQLGNNVRIQEWKDAKLDVLADALLVPGEHPPDTPDTVERAVVLTVTARAPDGTLVSSVTMRIERVVARRGPEGWRVEDVSFFPEDKFTTKTPSCPPGQSNQPAPDGPCVPNPPPPAKQCPDGVTVAPDEVCPPAQGGPETKMCPDGTSVPANGPCPQRRRRASLRKGDPCAKGIDDKAMAMTKMADELTKLQAQRRKMLETVVGFEYVHNLGSNTQEVKFNPAGPKPMGPDDAKYPSWVDINDLWIKASQEINDDAGRFPWLVGLLKDPSEGDSKLLLNSSIRCSLGRRSGWNFASRSTR